MKKTNKTDFGYSHVTLKNGAIIYCASYRWTGSNNIELLNADGSMVAAVTPDSLQLVEWQDGLRRQFTDAPKQNETW